MRTLLLLLSLCVLQAATSGKSVGDPCASNPCRNGGTCKLNRRGNQFHCNCLSHYTGEFCEESDCDPPCQNGGTCGRRSRCECPHGFRGKYCEQCVDEEDVKCPEWAEAGYCLHNSTLRAVCRASCKNCPSGSCTKDGEFCVHQAFCNTKRMCQCDNNLRGDGRLVCVQKGDNLCMIRTEPQLETYNGATGNLNFPCRYRLSHLSTMLPGRLREPGQTYCKMEVFGYGMVSKAGHHYPDAAEVRIALGDYMRDIFRQRSSAMLDDFSVEGATFSTSAGDKVRFGQSWHTDWNGLEIACLFDVKDKITIVEIPACHFRLLFRMYNESQEEEGGVQTRTPGIAVVTGKDAHVKELDKYPKSLCGVAGRRGDNAKVVKENAKDHEFMSLDEEVLFSALSQNVPQRSLVPEVQNVVLQDADSCQRAKDLFNACSSKQQLEVVRLCSPLLSSKHTLCCLGAHVMDAFADCVSIFCNNARNSECQRMVQRFRDNRCAFSADTVCDFPAFLQEPCGAYLAPKP